MTDQLDTLIQALKSDDESARRLAAEDLGWLKATEAAEPLFRILEDACAAVREAAVDALSMIGGEAVVRIVLPGLRSENVSVRNAACEVLRNVGEPAVDHLEHLLGDEDKDVRKFAVDVLAQIGCSSAGPLLVRALEDANINVASAAAEALGEIRFEDGVDAIVSSLQAGAWMRCAVAGSLGKIGGPQARRALTDLLGDSNDMVVYAAIQALAEAGDADTLQYLLLVLGHGSPMIVEATLAAMVRIIDRTDPSVLGALKGQMSADAVARMLRHGDPAMRRSGMRLAVALEPAEAVPLLIGSFAHEDESEADASRDAARQSLLVLARKDSRLLIDALSDPGLGATAIRILVEVLGGLGDVRACDAVARHLNHGDVRVRRAVVESLPSIDASRARVPLLAALRDPEDSVRACAARGLGVVDSQETESEEQTKASLDKLAGRLLHDCREVKEAAAWALAAIGSEGSVGRLLDSASAACPMVREVAVRALASCEGRDAARQAVRRALGDASPDVRLSALYGLAATGPVRVEEDILSGLRAADSRIRGATLTLLAEQDAGDWSPGLLEVLATDPSLDVRYRCAHALGKLDVAGAADAMIRILEDPAAHPLVLLGAIEAVGMLRAPQAREALIELTGHADQEIAGAAERSLVQLG